MDLSCRPAQGCMLKTAAVGGPRCATHRNCVEGCSVLSASWGLGSAPAVGSRSRDKHWSRGGWMVFLFSITAISLGCHVYRNHSE